MRTKIIDHLPPEDIAMLQALYSRSPASVDVHLEKVQRQGSGSFMDRYYVGYNHASIGDCGVTAVFQEGVSMLAAKAIQDWPLYSGQEASTRYMDFSHAEFSNPARSASGKAIQEGWRRFYLAAQEPMREHLRKQYPEGPDDDPKVYERAINARAFDVLRAFLPAGAATNVSWTTNLRQAADKLDGLRNHPHPQIRHGAQEMFDKLLAKYPHSFRAGEIRHAEYLQRSEEAAFYECDADFPRPGASQAEREHELDDVALMATFAESRMAQETLALLNERPRGAPVPRFLAELGLIRSEFTLDFGSFRDLQRHRNGVIRMPLLTTQLGFHPWYLEQLPDDLRAEAAGFVAQQTANIEALHGVSKWERQDYIAMGYRVPIRVTQSLPAFIYRIELRSSKTVHPTLRRVVKLEAARFRQLFPQVTIYVDHSPDDWTLRRGEQTITEKPEPTAAEIRERATGAWENWTQEEVERELRGAALLSEGSPNTPQPRPEPSDHPAVWDLVLADIAERDAMGQAKYGQRLKPHDGRKNLHDIYQELMDGLVYVRKEIYERTGR